MNILDDTENDSGILAEDHLDGAENFDREYAAGLDEEHDFESEEARGLEVRLELEMSIWTGKQ